jgi:hypothetical protein
MNKERRMRGITNVLRKTETKNAYMVAEKLVKKAEHLGTDGRNAILNAGTYPKFFNWEGS